MRRTHWQVTTASDATPTTSGGMLPFNTSFYLVARQDEPLHVRVHDHRSTIRYLCYLLCFHLGFEVLA